MRTALSTSPPHTLPLTSWHPKLEEPSKSIEKHSRYQWLYFTSGFTGSSDWAKIGHFVPRYRMAKEFSKLVKRLGSYEYFRFDRKWVQNTTIVPRAVCNPVPKEFSNSRRKCGRYRNFRWKTGWTNPPLRAKLKVPISPVFLVRIKQFLRHPSHNGTLQLFRSGRKFPRPFIYPNKFPTP